IGVIYPLSGNAANAGRSALDAVQLAVDIINTPHPELSKLPSVGPGVLSYLGGAKIQVVSADHQGNPAEGQSQTLRLRTQEKVVAFDGSYRLNVSLMAPAVAERYGIPFNVGDSVPLNIMSRGFKWVFRTTTIATDFAKNYMLFLADMKKAGHNVSTIA